MKLIAKLCHLYAKDNYEPSEDETLELLQQMILNRKLKLRCRQKIAEAIIEQERSVH
jgi:hypothetical protein